MSIGEAMAVCDRMQALSFGSTEAKAWVKQLVEITEAGASEDEIYEHWLKIPVLVRPKMLRIIEKFLAS